MFAIPSATVPIGTQDSHSSESCRTTILFHCNIVKFHDPSTGLDCDVNVNDQLGVINSELLRAYCDISPILRPMIKAIKRWAKPLGLNNPSGQGGGGMTFNSYTLTVMTVAFLQVMLFRCGFIEAASSYANLLPFAWRRVLACCRTSRMDCRLSPTDEILASFGFECVTINVFRVIYVFARSKVSQFRRSTQSRSCCPDG